MKRLLTWGSLLVTLFAAGMAYVLINAVRPSDMLGVHISLGLVGLVGILSLSIALLAGLLLTLDLRRLARKNRRAGYFPDYLLNSGASTSGVKIHSAPGRDTGRDAGTSSAAYPDKLGH